MIEFTDDEIKEDLWAWNDFQDRLEEEEEVLKSVEGNIQGDRTMRNSALVKVVSTGKLKVPFDFPYRDFVRLTLLGDTEDLENPRFELTAIKDQVNCDISRFKMNLVDFRIVIKLELGNKP